MDQRILVENLGLTDKEAAVYLAILELGASTVQPIANHSGVKRTSIYYFINHLVELGLVEVAKVRNRLTYKALSPERMVSLQENRLKEIRQALPSFLSVFNVSTEKPKISYFEGPEQMKNILLEEARCKKELLAIWSAQEVTELFGTKLLKETNDTRRAKGVHVRVVRLKDNDESFGQFLGGEQENRELRYAPEGTNFPMAISIYDTGKVGLLTSRKEGFGILIESEEFTQAMRTLFEAFWSVSKE